MEIIFPAEHKIGADMCQHELKHRESGEPIKKPVEIRATSKLEQAFLPLCTGIRGFCSAGTGRARHRALEASFLKDGTKLRPAEVATKKFGQNLAVTISHLFRAKVPSLLAGTAQRPTKDREESSRLGNALRSLDGQELFESCESGSAAEDEEDLDVYWLE